jgi:probable phosphoglycerate mutase
MLRLHLLRHGQTDASKANRFSGMIDPPLNATGLAMAEAFAARWGGEKWTAIYASSLVRAQQTAAPTAARAGVEVRVEAGLREIAYGEWDGKLESEVEAQDPARFHAWAEHPGRVSPPGGESGEAIAARALPVIDAIRARHASGNVLIVSHKATLRVLMCSFLGVDVDQFRRRIDQTVCGLSIIDWKSSGPLLRKLNDVSHLPAELLAGDGT